LQTSWLLQIDHTVWKRSYNASPTVLYSIDIASVSVFGRPFVKRFALCYRSVVCLSVCNVRALWPNGWTDQDETWLAGRPRPWPHCVRWGASSPPLKGHSPQFSAHICCGQMDAWIKMSLGIEVGLGPGDFCVRWGPHSPSPKGGQTPQIFGPCLLRPKRLDG